MAIGKLLLAGGAAAGVYVAIPARHGPSGDVLEQPAPLALQRLEAKRRVVKGTGLGSLTIDSGGTHDGALLIRVTRAGARRSVKCRVTIAPVSDRQSRAAVDCTQARAADRPIARVAEQAFAIVVREHVAATVAARPYDTDGVADRMVALVAANRAVLALAAF